MENTQKPKGYDVNAISRQLAVYGAEAMGKLITMKVFIQGLRGIGIEAAKNLILAGPETVVLHDEELVQINDLGSNFYCEKSHVGKVTRAEASLGQLTELNTSVKVSVHQGPITEELLSHFNVVVFTNFFNRDALVKFNDFCHSKNIGFIYTGELGLYGFTFVDYGDAHQVFDQTGQDSKNFVIAGITQDQEGLVTVDDGQRHNFQDGDTVVFKEVEGMTELNDQRFQIKYKSPYTFTIGDTRGFSPYLRQGIVEHVKVIKDFAFAPLSERLTRPVPEGKTELDMLDFSQFFRSELLHLGLLGLLDFVAQKGRLPELNNETDADDVLARTQELNRNFAEQKEKGTVSVEKVDAEIVKNIARFARASISPNASFWGGIVAQEIVKFTGKFVPIRQWLHNEFFEALPTTKVDRTPLNNRYDDQIAIFGREFQAAIAKKRTFMIGAGALGCEFLKMFALMGLGTEGLLTVADDDNIEISNLNRQFLFRRENVGSAQCSSAVKRVERMNPDFKAKAIKSLVNENSEVVFNDEYWENLDLVVNAVDNIKARMYVDSQCVWYSQPLFESGTLGTKCNSQIIIPHMTASYGESSDPPEESIPLCTLKNFPYLIDHCIQWARDYFEGTFVEAPADLARFIEDPAKFLEKAKKELSQQSAVLKSKLDRLNLILKAYAQGTFESCVELARYVFNDVHTEQIAQLLHCFPQDHKTEQGQLFWSGPKRCPLVIEYSSSDPKHLEYVQGAANVFAFIFGLPQEKDAKKVAELANQIHIEPFKPKNIQIKVDEKEPAPQAEPDDAQELENLIRQLLSVKVNQAGKVTPIEFEKDDETNWHIEVVSGIANMRARNYNIKEIDNFQVKLIAGQIIPALATTTAMVVGAVGIEVIKYLNGKKFEDYRNSFINLALPVFLFSEPQQPKQVTDKEMDPITMCESKAIPPNHTRWTILELKGPLTIGQLIERFQVEYKVDVNMIMYGSTPIYLPFMDKNHKQKLPQDIIKTLETITKQTVPEYKQNIHLTVGGDLLEDSSISAQFPEIKYTFK